MYTVARFVPPSPERFADAVAPAAAELARRIG